jgi:hypothetical protein
LESDEYLCAECSHRFSVDWRRGPAKEPCWPDSPEAIAEARRLVALLREQRRAST